jgi:contact-dependent growth inhibition (CDI) system CdiI-like immunity protein
MNKFPALEQLFSGHLHEDWADDYADSLQAVDAFVEGQPSYAPAAPGELAQLLAMCDSEAALEQALINLGMDYYPPGDGWDTYRAWTLAVAARLDEALHRSPAA